jgi:hypothetical protein
MVLAVTGGVDGGIGTGLLIITGEACLTAGEEDAAAGCDLEETPATAGEPFDGTLGAGFDTDTGFFAGTDTDLEGRDLDGTDLEETGATFLAGVATFFATGLAILLATGPFLASLLPPDEWTGLAAAFFAGTIFLTLIGFLAGFAAFFLVAIQLGFFSDKHF